MKWVTRWFRGPRLLRSGAVGALFYAIAVLAYVSSSPDVRLRCLLADSLDDRGLLISAAPGLEDEFVDVPQAGDVLVELAGRPVDNFLQFSRGLVRPRGQTLEAGASLLTGQDPLELSTSTPLWLVEMDRAGASTTAVRDRLQSGQTARDRQRRVKVRYVRAGESEPQLVWLPLQSLPAGRMTLTLAWLAVQIGLFLFAAIVHWRRPQDRSASVFLALCSVTLISLVGGSYWWIVAASSALAVPFLVASCFLPATLVHFFLLFPRPRWWLRQSGVWPLATLYGPAVLASVLLVLLSLGGWVLTPHELPSGPWAGFIQSFQGAAGDFTLTTLRSVIYVYAAVAALYVTIGLAVLVGASRKAAVESERRQLKYMLLAGLVACGPIGYVLWLAIVDQSRLALGEAQLALYGTSFIIAAAYAVGLLRARPTFLDEASEQGFRYALLRSGTALLFSVAVALAGIGAVSPNLPWYGSTVLTTVTLTVAVLLAWWLRERLQQAIDRRFYRERFRLDRAVQGIYHAADESLDPDVLGEKTLQSCREALDVERAAMYVRERGVFRITVRDLDWTGPTELRPDEPALDRFREGTLLQRAPGIQNGVQDLLHVAGAEAIQPVTNREGVVGLILLGQRRDGQGFTADDASFLAALGPMTGAALESARIHQNIAQLDDELRARIERIEQQEREIRLLKSELAEYHDANPLKAAANKRDTRTRHEADVHDRAKRPTHVLGSSIVIREVLATARKVAASDASVLIRGESGTGKELLARTIHEASPRAGGPLVALHCAALTSSLLESELFGHVKGAFTDARSDRPGRIEQADGGTLFLDEVGDIPLDVQVKLLRVLQERVVERVGATESRPVDVRIVAATHQNLEQLIRAGRFREDLLYRLNVVELHLPPLRDRGTDVIELADLFLQDAARKGGHAAESFSDESILALKNYAWPGNVRQLQNVVSRAVVLAEDTIVEVTDLPNELHQTETASRRRPSTVEPVTTARPTRAWDTATSPVEEPRPPAAAAESFDTPATAVQTEITMLRDALAATNGNKAAAARALGIPRSTFFSKLKKHGLT